MVSSGGNVETSRRNENNETSWRLIQKQTRIGHHVASQSSFPDFSLIFSVFQWFFSFQSVGEFLKDLPVHNEENFSLYDNARTSSMKRPSVYLPTIDIPAEQSKMMNHENGSLTNLLRSLFSYYHREEKHFIAILAPDLGQEERTEEARSRVTTL